LTRSLLRATLTATFALLLAGGFTLAGAGADSPWTLVTNDGRTFTPPETTAGGKAFVPVRAEN